LRLSSARILRKTPCARRASFRTMPVRVHLRELRAEEKDLRGVIDPYQNEYDGPRRPVTRADGAVPQVQADRELADVEEQGRDDRADDDVAPSDAHRGQDLVDHGEEHGDER